MREELKQAILGDEGLAYAAGSEVYFNPRTGDGFKFDSYYRNDNNFFEAFLWDNKPFDLVDAIYYGKYDIKDEYVTITDAGFCDTISAHEYKQLIREEIDDLVDELIDRGVTLEYLESEKGKYI